MEQLQGALGVVAILAFAWLVSENRGAIRNPRQIRLVAAGLVLIAGFGLLFLKFDLGSAVFTVLGAVVTALDTATVAGTSFVFGYVGGGEAPFDVKDGESAAVLAFRFLPVILLISALSALLFHWRVLPLIVNGLSWALQRTLGIRGALGIGAAANVFVGMVESPVLIRPYLARITRGELFAVMTVGLATLAGTVLVLYATILKPVIPGSLGHVLTASVLNVAAALVVAGLMVPFAGDGTEGRLDPGERADSAMDALARGVANGVLLILHVAAMLIVLVALVALVNLILGSLIDVGGVPLTLERIFGWVLAPLAWLIGIPWAEAGTAGQLLGTKVVLNELKAFVDMSKLAAGELSERSRLILVYAMCGFANLGSLGIMVGGIGALAPERRAEVAALGMKSLAAGLLSTCLTASIISLMI